MRLALLKGNRFNPWHLAAFNRLRNDPSIVAFRAESEIQQRFSIHESVSFNGSYERIYYESQAGNPFKRIHRRLAERWLGAEPRIIPFADRLKGFDVLQSWELFTDWTAEAVKAKERYGTPLSIMVWDNIPFNMENADYRGAIKGAAIASGDVFIVHSERSERTLVLEGVPLEKVRRINPGVDLETFAPGERRRDALPVEDDEFVILFAGWLLPRKGAEFLILALRELINDTALKDCKFRLLLIGADPGKPRLEKLIRRLGLESSVTFLGAVPYPQMPDAYRAADVFVLPSIATPHWQEQFGMSLIEAMACGTPVVTTYSGAIPEVAGDAAVLCQPNDFLSLYRAIRRLIQEPKLDQELREKGRRRAETHFAIDAFAESLSQVYDELTG